MNQNTPTPSEYKQAQYTLWQPLEETWSAPASYAEALEAYARASKLIIIYILGSLYLAGGGAILYGLLGRFLATEEAIAYIIVGAAIIVAAILAQRYIKKK